MKITQKFYPLHAKNAWSEKITDISQTVSLIQNFLSENDFFSDFRFYAREDERNHGGTLKMASDSEGAFYCVIWRRSWIRLSVGIRQSARSSGYQIRVFTIALCYIVATMASFQAFTMIAPGAALGARCSSRTFFAILLSFFCLKEKILKFEILSVLFCTVGLLFYAGDSIMRSMSVNNGTALPQNLLVGLGFGLCAIAGLSRSVGMTMYRKIKVEIDPVTIVLVHSLMTVIAVIPVMLEFESFNLPKRTTGWVYLVCACCSATIATFSSNWAIQYINPGLASVAQNTDIIVSVTLEHLVIKTLPSGLEIAAVIFVLLGTSSLPLFRYWESLKREQEDQYDDAKALLK
ncbi:unnamed protein product [Oikopleura dioica]|uniref:EamA domain-containing protein n=1 Tax=Oikopleura dioica TaxID=34765 RepID=E4YHN9_OIKDI|nr:unnamed protein product [Oikopleura dioica]